MYKDQGLSVFTESAKAVYQELVAIQSDLKNGADKKVLSDRVARALGAAEAAKKAIAENGDELASLLQRQSSGLNLHIHVHTKE